LFWWCPRSITEENRDATGKKAYRYATGKEGNRNASISNNRGKTEMQQERRHQQQQRKKDSNRKEGMGKTLRYPTGNNNRGKETQESTSPGVCVAASGRRQ
jgi:hypothetical protein